MGKKYIVEIGRLERLYKASVNGNGKPNMTWLSPEVDLTPYTEPDLHEVRKKAYEKGYHDAAYNCHEGCNFLDDAKKKADEEYRRGYADCEAHYKAMVQDSDTTEGADAYQRGLADAWEAAKKIALMDIETSENVTGYFGLFRIMENLTPMQAIEKIRQYEQENQFRVGDEFETESGKRFVIVKMNGKEVDRYIDEEGKTYCMIVKYQVMRKTGRHFPEIATVLEKMREESNG